MRWLIWLLASGIAGAQPSDMEAIRQGVPGIAPTGIGLRKELDGRKQPESGMEAGLRAQRASFVLQHASVQKQAAISSAGTHTFFTAPWTEPAEPGAIAAITTGASSAGWSRPPCEPLPASEADALVRENAEKQNLGPELLRAVIAQESAFYPCAVSSKGALGLMQLMPATAESLGVTDAFDPAQNVGAGAKLLKQLLDRYGGDLALALSAYNAGPGRVAASGGIPAIPETRNYVANILNAVSQ